MSNSTDTDPLRVTNDLLRNRISHLTDEVHNLRMICFDLFGEHTCADRAKSRAWIAVDRECARCRGEGAFRHYEQIRNSRYG